MGWDFTFQAPYAGGWEEASGRPSPGALSRACRNAQDGWDRESSPWGLLESWAWAGRALGAFTPRAFARLHYCFYTVLGSGLRASRVLALHPQGSPASSPVTTPDSQMTLRQG